MPMRKFMRRRSASRALLQNLETRPFSEGLPPPSEGWLKQPRARLAHSSRSARLGHGERR